MGASAELRRKGVEFMLSTVNNRIPIILAAIGVSLLIVTSVIVLVRTLRSGPQRPEPVPEPTATATTLVLATNTVAPTTIAERPRVTTSTPSPQSRVTRPATMTATLPAAETPSPSPTPAVTPTPAAAPATGSIEGAVSLEGRSTALGITILVDGTPEDTTDAAGTFRVPLQPGLYRVRASYPTHIPIEAQGVEVLQGKIVSLPPAALPAGDTDWDSDVDLFDLVRCVVKMRGGPLPEGAHADTNGDGITDIRDVILTRQNYGISSPAPWSQ